MAGVHSPSIYDPADYKELGIFYVGDSEEMNDAYRWDHEALQTEYSRHFGYTTDDAAFQDAKSTCDSCGARFAHGAMFVYLPENYTVSIGHICAQDFGLSNKAEKARAKNERAAAAAKERAEKKEQGGLFLSEHFGEIFDFVERTKDDPVAVEATSYARGVWADMSESALQYGSLTDGQLTFAYKLLEEAPARIEKQRQWEAEKADRTPVPVTDERITITGEILSLKWKDGPVYGSGSWKVVVKDDRGFRVWGTLPSKAQKYTDANGDVQYTEVGDKIRFDAKVEVSEDDETFGFYSRPTKAEVMEVVA